MDKDNQEYYEPKNDAQGRMTTRSKVNIKKPARYRGDSKSIDGDDNKSEGEVEGAEDDPEAPEEDDGPEPKPGQPFVEPCQNCVKDKGKNVECLAPPKISQNACQRCMSKNLRCTYSKRRLTGTSGKALLR
ncbi:hypothetical protein CPB83DRAFT_841174 [Crepidotus variabilis]|uniref:Uncharacterized protein n=1 Tax=Crepidotus variabilis TaxID=179855 RepID=A0A9P6JHR7_9AGAR|nr:hypothetical protein CPB83DRAFT_841174 [Crepidotus variabilis]